MADAKKCDICGKYFDTNDISAKIINHRLGTVRDQDICPECEHLIESFIKCIKEGTLAVGLLDYLISVYGEDKLINMLRQRGEKNGETEN